MARRWYTDSVFPQRSSGRRNVQFSQFSSRKSLSVIVMRARISRVRFGADGGTRTHNAQRPRDFKSRAYANSATSAKPDEPGDSTTVHGPKPESKSQSGMLKARSRSHDCHGDVLELVDRHDLGSCAFWREGSSPSIPTNAPKFGGSSRGRLAPGF